jgi:hypothetical protein
VSWDDPGNVVAAAAVALVECIRHIRQYSSLSAPSFVAGESAWLGLNRLDLAEELVVRQEA